MSAHEVKNCPFCGVTPPIPIGTKGVWRQHHAVRCGTANCYGNPLNCKTYATQEEAIAAWNRRAQPAEEVQPVGDMVLMPRRLTAENGAKGALSGEFSERFSTDCPVCDADEPDTECDICSGSGRFIAPVPVEWDTIKRIYKAAVELLGTRPPAADADRLNAKRWRAMRATTTALRNSDGERIECTPEELDAAADSLIAKLAAIDAALAASKEKKE